MSEVILGLGSNIGNPVIQLQNAVNYIKQHFFILKSSKIYISQSLLKDEQPDYYNIAIKCKTDEKPLKVLEITQSIEKEMGRIKTKVWGERIIDIDIIDYDNKIFEYDDLVIPHSQMGKRSFVLKPMMDICQNYKHPKTNKSLDYMYGELTDVFNIKVCNDFQIKI